MNVKLSRKWWISIGATVTLSILAGLVGVAVAQSPGGDMSLHPSGGGADETHTFSYQGRLIIGGQPANGSYDFLIYLYTAESEGTYLGTCNDINSLDGNNTQSVVDGLFTLHLICADWNSKAFIGGESRWLEVRERPTGTTSWTLLGRQPVSPVPYAWSLYPGAAINGGVASPSAVISTTQTFDPVSGDAAFALYGYAPEVGVYGGAIETGVWGHSYGHQGHRAGVYGDSVVGKGVHGTSNASHGVYGESGAGTPNVGYGGFFVNTGGGGLLAANDVASTSDLEFMVDNDGDVYADRAYHCGIDDTNTDDIPPCLIDNSPADFAEVLPTTDTLKPGDVLAIAPDGKLVRSASPYQTSVVGIYSAAPSYVGGGANLGQEGYAPLAIVGLVPVKASAENGSILPGDLLVASSTPGHAMKAGTNPPVGTVIGKALEPLRDGKGVIKILVMLQ